MAELVVHVGMGKAASTTIQRSVLGDPSAPKSIGRHNRSSEESNTLGPMWWRHLMSPVPELADSALRAVERVCHSDHGVVVLSDEVVSASPVLMDNFLANLSRSDIRVTFLIVLREQRQFLESFFNHGMRSRVNAFGLPLLHNVLANRLQYQGDIDTWADDLLSATEKGDRNVLEPLSYDRLISKLQQVSDGGEVVALPLELLRLDSDVFATHLARLFRMEKYVVQQRLEKKENVTGQRLRDFRLGGAVENLMSKPFLTPMRRLGLTRASATRYVLPILSKLSPRSKSVMSDHTAHRIAHYFSPSNQALSRRLPFDMEGLGYHCLTIGGK